MPRKPNPDQYADKPILNTTGSGGTSSGQSDMNMLANTPFGMEDTQNRTRNAVAQRRHREKRKAHLKNLEESVQTLTSELDSARRQMATGSGFAGPSRLAMGGSRSLPDIQAENAFLREQNEELRRQLHAYRETYPHLPPPLPLPSVNPEKTEWEHRGQFGVTYGQSGISPVKAERDDASSNSAPGTAGYQPTDPFGSILDGRQPRSRVLSASSAPQNQSPFVPSASAFPTDPRAHSLASSANPVPPPANPSDSRYQVRYDQPHLYTGSHAPTQAPRFDMSHQTYNSSTSSTRQDGDMSWASEHAAPPPFAASGPYNMSFQQQQQHQQQQQQQQQHHPEWRHGGHE